MTTTPAGHLRRRVATGSALAAVGLLLTGCGGEADRDAGPAGQGTPTASEVTPGATPGTSTGTSPGGAPSPRVGDVDFTELAAFTETRLRMEEGTATPLPSQEAVTRWLPRRAPQRLVADVDAAAALVGDGVAPYGLVLAVGCDAPASYTLERVDGEIAVVVEKSLTTTQCVAPMTWLAVVGVGMDG